MGLASNNNGSRWDIDSLSQYLGKIVENESGNVFEEKQLPMITSRLKKRLLDLGDLSPDEYFRYLNTHYKQEVGELVSLLTTHHTYFFREFCHFEYLLANLGQMVMEAKSRGTNKIRVLSLACSKGQEVYSLAMFFEKHLSLYPGMTYEIIGTDIDPQCIKHAKNGVYPYEEVKKIPVLYLNGNWKRGTGSIRQFALVKPHISSKCRFHVMNLLKIDPQILNGKFDVIMCRNVFIYFDLASTKKIIESIFGFFHERAVFITGLSESLNYIDIKKKMLAPSVYRLGDDSASPVKVPLKDKEPAPPPSSPLPRPIKILSVDDSTTVLKLLEKVFGNDSDFKLVGTAKDALEAVEFLKNNEVDAMTLDIHMPEMTGVEYLKKYYRKGHPHVVMVSSVSREDARFAQEALEYGASDFVEKPTLNAIFEKAEEIKMKVKMAFYNQLGQSKDSLDKQFKKSVEIVGTENKARLLIGTIGDLKKISQSISELKGDQPPIIIFFDGNDTILDIARMEMAKKFKIFTDDPQTSSFKANQIYLFELSSAFSSVYRSIRDKKLSISLFGHCTNRILRSLSPVDNAQLLLEDLPDINTSLKKKATDIVPWTSFSYVGSNYLSKDDN